MKCYYNVRHCQGIFILFCCVLVMISGQGLYLSMISTNQVYILNEGESIILECVFHADDYSLFNYPVVWVKEQGDEATEMNIMGNLNEPFLHDGRFTTSFASNGPRYRFELAILNVLNIDSGNYSCQVKGQHPRVIDYVVNYVYVREAVESVIITINETITVRSNQSITALHVTEGGSLGVRCLSYGGYPPPEVSLWIEDRDLTDKFHARQTMTLKGHRGLRSMTYLTERWTHSYRPTAQDNGCVLQCRVLVRGLDAQSEHVHLDISYSPKIRCEETKVHLFESNARLVCLVEANPPLTNMFWIIDSNGTTVTADSAMEHHWTMTTKFRNGSTGAELYIREVRRSDLRKYSLVAENSIGLTISDLLVQQKKYDSELRKEVLADAAVLSEAGSAAQLKRDDYSLDDYSGDDVSVKQRNVYDDAAASICRPYTIYTILILQLFSIKL